MPILTTRLGSFDDSHEYMSWEQVLNELQISEENLQNIVAETRLRAFKDGGTLRFRRTDVEKYKFRTEDEED
ncbi:MAG: hypothetical protein QF437_21130 [Planctomycetota bacterium]|jgi:excisionase family DNA binding protein|nr:hypothetical protein [Planctomycetota bacterium]MDP7133012.1 hypothetical protein [Planctomycetota bacterium]MDP7250864.1 hypothetical protein [Planctomycetota bacterium]